MNYLKKEKECENKTTIFYDEEKYIKYYNVLYTWNDIKNKILKTYSNPIIRINTNIHKQYKILLNNINSNFFSQSYIGLRNSLYYMFYKYKNFFYIRIRNNELTIFCYCYNINYDNPLYEHFNKLHIDPIKQKYFNYIQTENKKKWIDLGSVIKPFEKKYKGFAIDFYYYEMKYFITELLKKYKIQDCDFIISNKDRLSIKKDLTEASEELVGSTVFPLQKKFKKNKYLPILSFSHNERYADFPIPTPDDIVRIYNLFIPPKCNNLYNSKLNTDWNSKIPKAVFRGSYTGSSSKLKTNPRLHISYLSNKWSYKKNKNNLLDAGITSFNGINRGRKELNNNFLRFLDKNYTHYLKKDFMTYENQSNYKYIVYIEGNISAYRAAYLFSFNSVVLWIKSNKYHLWFEELLEDKKNCVFIENNLSNLEQNIKWLKSNDDIAIKIAKNGNKLYNTFLSKKSIEDYMVNLLNSFK